MGPLAKEAIGQTLSKRNYILKFAGSCEWSEAKADWIETISMGLTKPCDTLRKSGLGKLMVGHPFGLNTQGRFAILGLGMLVVPIKWKVCRLPDWTRKNKSTDPSIAAGCETLNMKATICRHLHLLTKPTKISKSGSKQSTSISFRNKLRRILGYLMDLHPSTCDTILWSVQSHYKSQEEASFRNYNPTQWSWRRRIQKSGD